MADPRELGGLLYEREAELAYSKQDEIEAAAEWCKRRGPHKLAFLQSIRELLLAEEIQLIRMGFKESIRIGAIKKTPVLLLLTPSQAIRLLECYKRAILNTKEVWRAKDIHAIDDIERELKHKAFIDNCKEQIKQKIAKNKRPEDG